MERAIARAQELVDRKREGQSGLPWYFEAMQVGDLSLLALLLQRPAPSEEEARQSPEARRQMALDDWVREEGLSGDDPKGVMRRMTELGPKELERTLRGHEARRMRLLGRRAAG